MASLNQGGVYLAGLILAAALSVALAHQEPAISDSSSRISIISEAYNIQKIQAPTKTEIKKKITTQPKTQTKKPILDNKAIIKITGLDPSTVHTIINESKKSGVDPFLILGLLKTESSFNPKATSRNGAKGLGQIMTATGRWTAKRSGLTFSSRSLYNPTYNAKLTVTYFSYLFKAYKGNKHRALTAYNRGIGGLKYYERRAGTAKSSYSAKVLKNTTLLEKKYAALKK